MAGKEREGHLLQPAWQISLRRGGSTRDLTPTLSDRLISLSIDDERGIESDTLSIVLDDQDGTLALPPTGALLAVSIGWAGDALVQKGTFVVDEIEYDGPPGKLSLRARAAPVSGGNLAKKKERSWDGKTLGNIARTVAADHKLKPVIHGSLDPFVIPHVDQTNESDVNFLTRIGKRFDAIVTVKDGHLLLMPSNQGASVGGKALKTFTIDSRRCVSYRYQSAERGQFSGVQAHWYDVNGCQRETVTAGTSEQVKTLRENFASQAEASAAAKAEWQRVQHGKATLSVKLATGEPGLIPESPVTATGFKPEITGTPWVAVKVRHAIDGNGYTTEVEMETR